jgi:hypothetical protein
MAGLCYAGALYFHAVVGLSLLLCAGAAFIGLAAAGRVRGGRGESSRCVFGIIVLAVATAALSPYLATIISFTERGGALPFAVNGGFLWTLCAAGILPLCLVVVRLSSHTPSAAERFIYCFIAAAILLGTFARMPLGNADKFVYIVFLPLIALAGGTVPAMLRRMRALGALRPFVLAAAGLCAVATVSLGIAGCILDPGVDVPVPVAGGAVSLGPAERDAYRWLEEQTAEDAIMINADRRDLPVLARRRQLWTRSTYAEIWGYPDESIGWREEAVGALRAGRPVPVETWMKLFALGGPVYLIVRPEDPAWSGDGETMRDLERYREVFANEEFSVFEMLPRFE